MNIPFKTKKIVAYFEGHRDRWEDFYPSERWVIERMAAARSGLGKVLDVGCAMGGLGRALSEKGFAASYSGLDINQPAIEAANSAIDKFSIPVKLECGDILDAAHFSGEAFDTVFSLSCADWNVETDKILNACWARVAPGGAFILSLRLTNQEGVNDIRRSYQPIVAAGVEEGPVETANYVVFGIQDVLSRFNRLNPPAAALLGYGYWGKPSKTAVTPYSDLVFAVFAVTKGAEKEGAPSMELHLPLSLWNPAERRR